MAAQSGLQIQVRGIVQGVGFRPFIYGLATRLELTGWVRNTSSGVEIEGGYRRKKRDSRQSRSTL
jgi:hydrogenase maturation factor HypF (carbamoyltransferase family)